MPRKHIHIPGTAYRRNYRQDLMENALREVLENGLSFGQAAEQYQVPKATLYKKYRGMHGDKLGKPPALSSKEEKLISQAVLTAAEYRVPFTEAVLRDFVQQYLNRKGVNISSFVENRPGKDWCKYFLSRHPELSQRNSENIKRCRAELDPGVLTDYFDHLHQTTDGVPQCNIINYDETNITDDPGSEKVFVRRGSKHASRILDTSKTSTSIMFSACADGTLLPIYIVFKAKYLYPDWMEGGPEGARYNRSASGWFDADIFEDWFMQVALPFLRRKDGKKVILGDNLGSHLSYNVLKSCEENNIAFVLLPKNSTHICQPLDVAVFRPLKRSWKKILTNWKIHNKGVVPKNDISKLLNMLIQDNVENIKQNIIAGFAATGIYPHKPAAVLNKLQPANHQISNNDLTQTFTNIMTALTKVNERSIVTRKRKINVPAGKSISTADLLENNEQLNEEANQNHDELDEYQEASQSSRSGESHNESLTHTKFPVKTIYDIAEGSFVIVNFLYDEGTKKEHEKCFVALIVKLKKKSIQVSCLRQYKNKKNVFVFPNTLDLIDVKLAQIKYKLSNPAINRSIHTFPANVL